MSETKNFYHIGVDTSNDLKIIFGDIKFFILQGSPDRTKYLAEEVGNKLNLSPILIGSSERFTSYKVGHIMFMSHGMGMPSTSILLNEIAGICDIVGTKDLITIIRIGTCGGIDVEPGSLVVSNKYYSGLLEDCKRTYILGKEVVMPTNPCESLDNDLYRFGRQHGYKMVQGGTMSCDGFFEEQARLDGIFHDYSEKDKSDYLKTLKNLGIRNIEMEALYINAFCTKANIQSAVVCVALLNRLNGDQIDTPPEIMNQWKVNMYNFIYDYVMEKLK